MFVVVERGFKKNRASEKAALRIVNSKALLGQQLGGTGREH